MLSFLPHQTQEEIGENDVNPSPEINKKFNNLVILELDNPAVHFIILKRVGWISFKTPLCYKE